MCAKTIIDRLLRFTFPPIPISIGRHDAVVTESERPTGHDGGFPRIP